MGFWCPRFQNNWGGFGNDATCFVMGRGAGRGCYLLLHLRQRNPSGWPWHFISEMYKLMLSALTIVFLHASLISSLRQRKLGLRDGGHLMV